MSLPRHPEKAVFFTGLLFSDNAVFHDILPYLTNQFGDVLYQSRVLDWTHTSYYDKELGAPIFRNFIFFDSVIDPYSLTRAKLETTKLETLFAVDGKRRINIDPGYLTLAKVVLASLKNYSHRIYLGSSVYAELELFYKDGRFNSMPYTYYDYKDEATINIFTEARSRFRKIAPQGSPSFLAGLNNEAVPGLKGPAED